MVRSVMSCLRFSNGALRLLLAESKYLMRRGQESFFASFAPLRETHPSFVHRRPVCFAFSRIRFRAA